MIHPHAHIAIFTLLSFFLLVWCGRARAEAPPRQQHVQRSLEHSHTAKAPPALWHSPARR